MRKLLVILTVSCLAAVTHADLWINELHYDNDGGDVGEGFEVAGTAGTDLSDYTVYEYNGSDGGVGGSVTLSGTLTDESGGFGFSWFAFAGLQNGSPDGIALYNSDTTTLLQFLSYEGSFAAVDGVANGVTSDDIGVQETGTTTIGDTLQLSGTGSTYADFTWQSPASGTEGDINTGQTMAIPEPTTAALFGIALGVIGLYRRKRS